MVSSSLTTRFPSLATPKRCVKPDEAPQANLGNRAAITHEALVALVGWGKEGTVQQIFPGGHRSNECRQGVQGKPGHNTNHVMFAPEAQLGKRSLRSGAMVERNSVAQELKPVTI